MKIQIYGLLNLTYMKIGPCIMYIYVHLKLLFKNVFTDFVGWVTFEPNIYL